MNGVVYTYVCSVWCVEEAHGTSLANFLHLHVSRPDVIHYISRVMCHYTCTTVHMWYIRSYIVTFDGCFGYLRNPATWSVRVGPCTLCSAGGQPVRVPVNTQMNGHMCIAVCTVCGAVLCVVLCGAVWCFVCGALLCVVLCCVWCCVVCGALLCVVLCCVVLCCVVVVVIVLVLMSGESVRPHAQV